MRALPLPLASAAAAAATLLLLVQRIAAIPPHDASNFQGNYACASNVQLGKPQSALDVQYLVANAKQAKAVGLGHSWDREQMCAGDASSTNAVNVAVSVLDKSIEVDEAAQTVKVDAGVRTDRLLDYLAAYGKGWTLPAFPWFTYATIAGQVATDTHGSSMTYGSMGDNTQLLGMDVVLANGTLASFTQDGGYLWRALQANMGRLGIMTSLTFRIIPDALVRRNTTGRTVSELLAHFKQVQDGYRAQGDAAPAVRALDNTCYLWFITRDRGAAEATLHVQDEWVNGDMPLPPPTAPQQATDETVLSTVADGPVPDASAMPVAMPTVFTKRGATFNPVSTPTIWGLPRTFGDAVGALLAPAFRSGIYTARNASVHEPYDVAQNQADSYQYDQYEMAVPLDRIYDCYSALAQALYGPEQRWRGFRTPALVRFVKAQSGLLSPTQGGSRVYLNIEDLLKYNTYGATNQDFQAIWDLLRSPTAKAGFPEANPPFNGAKEYPQTWCDFGCATRALDPTGKFSGLSSKYFKWNFDMDACCTAQGFNAASCTCQ